MSASPPQLCVLGSVTRDLVIQTPRFPRPGETILGGPFESFVGGKGANQAVAAARLGAQVKFLGCVGVDDGGRAARAALRDAGVSCDGLVDRDTLHTGIGVITVSREGENHIVAAPGANHSVDAALVAEHANAIRRADALMLQLEIPLEANLAAAQLAHEAGVPVVLNAAPSAPLPEKFLRCIQTLIVNQVEYEELGRPEVPSLVVTYGKQGAVCFDHDTQGGARETRQSSFPVDPVDTTAAGDAFCAAATVAALEHNEPRKWLPFGTAAGALACTVAGAIPALPMRATVDTLLKESAFD
ncbi:MAG: ribokinase [Planctomycetes bacterium]|nr:ribokinase [Planctomycetota bacterium]